MDSSDSMDEKAMKSYDSSDTEEISEPPFSKRKKNIPRDENKSNISTPSKPSSSKRSRERQAKEGTKSSSKKMKKSAQVDDKGNATGVTEVEKSPWKRGLFWTPEDEVAYLKGLVAFCEKGKLRNLPKKMGHFFEGVRKDLDGRYSHDQLYSKLHWFKAKYFGARDKIKAKGFVGFKNAHEEAVYMLSKQVWGKEEEEKDGSEKMGKEGSARGEREKRLVVGECKRRGGEEERNKTGGLEMAVLEQEGDDDEEEEEEEGHDKGEQNDNVDVKEREASHISESARNRVAGMDTVDSEDNGGEETDSSEENVGEKESISEESEGTDLHNNGSRRVDIPHGNVTTNKFQGPSSLPTRSSFEREVPALSDKDVEMLDRKWQTQERIELDAAIKHIALLLEEYQQRLAKLSHK